MRLPFFLKIIFPFSYVEPFGYDNLANDGTVKFLAKVRKFLYLPEMWGRGEESNHRILKLHHTPTVCNILTSSPFADSETKGLTKKKNKEINNKGKT